MVLDANDLSELFLIESNRINREFDDDFIKLFSGTITESVSDSFLSSIKKFFANMITSIRNFMNKLMSAIAHGARESSYSVVLNKMEKQIIAAKKEGKTKVTMPDYKYIRKQYNSMRADLKKYANKFIKMKYTSTIDIDNDLETFMKIADSWDKKINDSLDKTVTMSIDDALKFVENEKRGYTHILDSLNDTIKTIEEMEHVAEETASRVDKLGSDIIPKHVNCIKRIATKISNKVTGFISKTIAVNVLLFA